MNVGRNLRAQLDDARRDIHVRHAALLGAGGERWPAVFSALAKIVLVGVDEDPVTGSAHCCLGPYWAVKLGKTELVGFQASARGGIVRVRVEDDRVHLDGQAVTVLRGGLAD